MALRETEREREAPWNGERPNGRMAGWLAGARAEAEGGAILRLTSERERERERSGTRYMVLWFSISNIPWFYGPFLVVHNLHWTMIIIDSFS